MPEHYTITATTEDGRKLTIDRDDLVEGIKYIESLPYKWQTIKAVRVYDHCKGGDDDA